MAPAPDPTANGGNAGGATREEAQMKVPAKDPKKKDDKKDEDLVSFSQMCFFFFHKFSDKGARIFFVVCC